MFISIFLRESAFSRSFVHPYPFRQEWAMSGLLLEFDLKGSFPFDLYEAVLGKVPRDGAGMDYVPLACQLFEVLEGSEATEAELGRGVDLLTTAIVNGHVGMYACQEMKNFLEKLPGLMEQAASGLQASALVTLLRCLLECQNEAVMNRIESVLPRICNGILRVAGAKCASSYPLDAIYCILSSRLHNVVRQQHNTITRLSVSCLAQPELVGAASNTLAALYSHSKPDVWTSTWRCHIAEMLRLLRIMGLMEESATTATATDAKEGGAGEKTMECIIAYEPWVDVRGRKDAATTVVTKKGSKNKKGQVESTTTPPSGGGCQKALAVARHFGAHCSVLLEMMRHGCSGGFVGLPVHEFVVVLSAVSSIENQMASGDPRNTIPNAKGFSMAHIGVVSAELKTCVASVLLNVMQGAGGALLVQGKDLLRCLSSLFCAADTMTSHKLLKVLLDCISVAGSKLPSLMGTIGEAILDRLASILEKSVGHATYAPTTLGKRIEIVMPLIDGDAICRCCEALLAYGGAFLPEKFRDSVEFSVGQALTCCCKGVQLGPLTRTGNMSHALIGIPLNDKDTKLHRAVSEVIRTDKVFRNSIIRLAVADVLATRRNGSLSSNLVLLKKACSACLKLPGVGSDDVVRATAIVNMALHPATLPVPVVNLTKLMRSAVTERAQAAFEGSSAKAGGEDQDGVDGEMDEDVDETSEHVVDSAEQGAAEAKVEKKRSYQPQEGDSENPFVAAQKKTSRVEAATLPPLGMAGGGDADDDDDELPDIKF